MTEQKPSANSLEAQCRCSAAGEIYPCPIHRIQKPSLVYLDESSPYPPEPDAREFWIYDQCDENDFYYCTEEPLRPSDYIHVIEKSALEEERLVWQAHYGVQNQKINALQKERDEFGKEIDRLINEHGDVSLQLAAAKSEINRLVYELDKSRDSHTKVIASQKALLEEMAGALGDILKAEELSSNFRAYLEQQFYPWAKELLAKYEAWKGK